MKLAVIETIIELSPIPDADRIELAQVQGWRSIVKKGDFKVGDKIVFIPIDTTLTPAPWNAFLNKSTDSTTPIRVKTVKMKGTVSQGLIFPLDIIPEDTLSNFIIEDGVDVSSYIGVEKYERPISPQLAGQARGNFPTNLISKTDEDNLLSNIRVFEELKKADYVDITLKLDGTSATYVLTTDGDFRVCSRNLDMKEGDSVYWQMARKYKIKERLQSLIELMNLQVGISMQGEIVGPGIQKNPLGLNEIEFFYFNLKNLSTGTYCGCAEDFQATEELPAIQGVPEIKFLDQEEFEKISVQDLQNLANELMYSKSSKPAEGIVIRGVNDSDGSVTFSQKLQKMLSVKIINQNYKD